MGALYVARRNSCGIIAKLFALQWRKTHKHCGMHLQNCANLLLQNWLSNAIVVLQNWKRIKIYENNEPNRGYSVLKESFTEHSDMRIECATSRQTVPVHDVRFSHRSIKQRFDDGRSLADLVEQLCRDEVHPLRDSFLRLRVWHFRGKLISRDNRRLYCLKKYQQ